MTMASGEEELAGLRLSEAFPDAKVAAMVAAARRGDFKEVDRLIVNGADVNYRGVQGITPLAWLVAAGDTRAIAQLLDAKADPNVKMEKNNSPISLAVELGTPVMLEQFLRKGGDPNLRGPDNAPLLHIAVLRRRKDQFDVLLEHGADVNAYNELYGSTAATVAVDVGHFDLAVYVLERGMNRDLQKLGIAAKNQEPKSVEQQQWKVRLIEMLKARGVAFPKEHS